MTLSAFLEAKPLYYDEIDYDRMPRTYAAVRDALPLPKIIHVVGTNGKGTTGRFIAAALHKSGHAVGHYTSPHILRFNERIWLNGRDADDAVLEEAHTELYALLGKERSDALSYFEYTTLLAMLVFRECEWVVLEAGLGGEHDATNVFPKTLSVFTPIDLDHQAFLGDTIESIAATKLRSMGPEALIGNQPHRQTYGIYDAIAAEKGTRNHRIKEILSDADMEMLTDTARRLQLPAYLTDNLLLAAAAVACTGIVPDPGLFEGLPLFGRLSRVGKNVTVDVGHNRLAAEAICRALYPQKVVLVYNTYKDKDYGAILEALKSVIERVEIIDVDAERIETRGRLERALEDSGIPYAPFRSVKEDDEYLVFGSFSVVEAFMRRYHA